MIDPKMILEKITESSKMSHITGKKILITAGPTREPIDPVRFISNYSSGKMGIAIANAAALMGANVDLIIGPAETDELIKNAQTKLEKKNLDMIVANIANHDLGLGFESDYNEVTIVTGDNIRNFPEERKTDLAFKIVDFISEEYFKKSSFQRKNA